jgi:glycosyltransferase involved in cell wall biosynthesis
MNRDVFAQRLDELLQDKEKAKRLGENGFEFVSERYDFPTYIEDLEKMFERVRSR